MLLAVADELDVVDEVLRALHPLRRLISDDSGLDQFVPDVADHEHPPDHQHELGGVEDAVIELIRWRLRRAAAAVRAVS